jgi:hypothetical protein
LEIAILAGAGSLAFSGPALAEGAKRLEATAGVQVVDESNVARSSADLAALRGIRPHDVIVTPTVTLDLLMPLSRQSLFLKGSLGYDFYQHNHVLNSERLDLEGGLNAQIARCKGRIVGDYARHQSDLQDLTLVVTRNIETVKAVGVEGSCGRPVGLAPTFSAKEQWSDNSASQLITSDYRTFTALGGLGYRRPSFGELSIYGTYQRTLYPNRGVPLGPASSEDGYKVYGGGARFDHRLGARIETTLKVAYKSLRPNVATLPGFNGVTWGADVTFAASPLARLHLGLEREVDPSNRPDTTYAVDTSYLAEGTYRLGRRMTLSAGASQRSSDYQGAALARGIDLTNDRLRSVFGAIGVNLGRRLSVKFDVRRDVRRANIEAFSYADTRLGVLAGVAF